MDECRGPTAEAVHRDTEVSVGGQAHAWESQCGSQQAEEPESELETSQEQSQLPKAGCPG